MAYDAVQAAVATATNDGLTEHAWNYDTSDGDPVTDLAAGLAAAARDFTATADTLNRLLGHVADTCRQHITTISAHATVYPHALPTDMTVLIQVLERFESHRDALLAQYTLWRRHRPANRDLRRHNLLVRPYDPAHGMVVLAPDETGMAWFVFPDPTATSVYGLSGGHDTVIGSIWSSRDGWQATAFTDPAHRNTPQAYPLPPAVSEDAACRALLRWWALQQSPLGAGRTPADLSPAEQTALLA